MIYRIVVILLSLPALAIALPITDFDAAIWYDDEAGATREASLSFVDNTDGDTVIENLWIIPHVLVEDQVSTSGWVTPWQSILTEYPWPTQSIIRDGLRWSLGHIEYAPGDSPYYKWGPISIYESLEVDEWGMPLVFGEIEGGLAPGFRFWKIVGGEHFHSPAEGEIGGELYLDYDPAQNFFGPIPEPATATLLLSALLVVCRKRCA